MMDESKFIRREDGYLVWKGGNDFTSPEAPMMVRHGGGWRPGCCAQITSTWYRKPCGRPPKFDPDEHGRMTKCGMHSAETLRKREDWKRDRTARWNSTRDRNARINAARDNAVTTLREIARGHNDPRALAMEAIAALDQAMGGE